MSGGHYNYAYHRVLEMAEADELQRTVLRKAFAEHLESVAEAMRAIEWVDSGDCSPGHEDDFIKEVLAARDIIDQHILILKQLVAGLQDTLKEIEDAQTGGDT